MSDFDKDANRILAYSYLESLIKKRKIKKANKFIGTSVTKGIEADFEKGELNFGELEETFNQVLLEIENTPDVRQSLVNTLKAMHEAGGDLNQLYSADAIVERSYDTFERVIFLEDD